MLEGDNISTNQNIEEDTGLLDFEDTLIEDTESNEGLLDLELISTLSEQDIEKLYLARYYYANGVDWLPNPDYDRLMEKLKNENPNHDLVIRTWSTDLTPYHLLEKYNLPFVEKPKPPLKALELPEDIKLLRKEYNNEILNYASSLFNRSIQLIREYNSIYKWITNLYRLGITNYHISIKADGFNYSATYIKKNKEDKYGVLVDVSTRSRDGQGLDITEQGRLVLPNTIEMKDTILKISGELVINPKYLPQLRTKYNKSFKTPRNAVSSMLRGGLAPDDIRLITALVFKVKSDYLNSLIEEFEWANKQGFNVPPFLAFTYTGDFNQIRSIIQYFEGYRYKLLYSSDGLVLGVNNDDEFYGLGGDDVHFNGNIACKVGVWDAGYYTSIVDDVVWEYNTKKITPVLVVEPVIVSTGAEVTRIAAHHPQRLIDLDIEIGSEVAFNYVSDSNIELVY